MRALTTIVGVLLLSAPASAQRREVRIHGARIAARDTSCWSSSQAPCDGVGRAELDVVTTGRSIDVRVVRVEVEVGDTWQTVRNIHLLRRLDRMRTEPPHRRRPVIHVRPHTTDVLFIYFDLVRAEDARVRITVEIDRRRATLEAEHQVLTEHPDPDL